MEKPTKTFGMDEPIHLYRKLLYDIERLRVEEASRAAQYAAFDCAVDAFHLIDWVLHAVDDEAHQRLTGKGRGKHGVIPGFITTNAIRLPDLELCRQIANSVKHVVMTFGPKMDNMSTGSTVRFEPPFVAYQPFPPGFRMFAWAYIELDGTKYAVIELFERMVREWEVFLRQEGLFVEESPDWEPDDEELEDEA
ncbi:hypothetical protein LJR098_001091 [Rhizobium sp. LjRoot98]|uniref:hypothetical protein n=1 Tax=Rhizobium sp. LjRoot98 TaxID=3342345 RepID=UPI003ECC965D